MDFQVSFFNLKTLYDGLCFAASTFIVKIGIHILVLHHYGNAHSVVSLLEKIMIIIARVVINDNV